VPIIQPQFAYKANWRRRLNGVNDNLMIKFEDEVLMLSVMKDDYAINREVL